MTATSPSVSSQAAQVFRIEVAPSALAGDSLGRTTQEQAAQIGIELDAVRSRKVYLIQGTLTESDAESIAAELLADPVSETWTLGSPDAPASDSTLEIHPLPGVMDPPSQTIADAIAAIYGHSVTVSTGQRFDLAGATEAQARTIAQRLLANPVVNAIHTAPFHPDALPSGSPYELAVATVSIRELDDAGLETLSRDGHLFLDLHEMRAIRDEYQTLGREPTDIELETLAQTWSEHCVHKTLKSHISYTNSGEPSNDPLSFEDRPGHTINDDGSVTINNLLKSTVAAATHELIDEGIDWTLSVFVDNAGIIRFDDDHAVCVKVETHNHPSAIEPYGGAATGIGGCIRDVIGTGLAAKPIASTDVFCVGTPEMANIPAGCLHPKRILTEVVAGVRDYGNRMGIPTVNGAVWFDERHVGNPLVFCGCIGVMPADLIAGDAKPGDRIIALGGRTGRDGIHGATFSSAELTDTHADEFSHAVQIGNAIEEKRVLDAILRARDARPADQGGPLFTSITDCGAGGFSSAVGEMGEQIGAEVHLDRAPLKYDGLSYTEIWISEAQERMVLAVPASDLPALQQICDEEHVELADLGHFGTEGAELILNYRGTEVGRLPMEFLHDGIPTPTREASWDIAAGSSVNAETPIQQPDTSEALLALLAHPNIASKHFIIQQYDHEVQGNTVGKPLVGPNLCGPSDAAIVEPVPGSGQGLAVACGLATGLESDPYLMTLAAVDECVRNLVCTGTDPSRIAILDNFCWPSCKKPENLGSLVRAAEGCYDAAKAYRTPFVSGKDSLNNQFTTEDGTTIEIPPTLLISGIGIVPSLSDAVSMDAKDAGHVLIEVGPTPTSLAGSHYAGLFGSDDNQLPRTDLTLGPALARAVFGLIQKGLIQAAHDVSDGGLACAAAEMLIAGSTDHAPMGAALEVNDSRELFAEGPSRYLLEIREADEAAVASHLADLPHRRVGVVNNSGQLSIGSGSMSISELTNAWRGTLDW